MGATAGQMAGAVIECGSFCRQLLRRPSAASHLHVVHHVLQVWEGCCQGCNKLGVQHLLHHLPSSCWVGLDRSKGGERKVIVDGCNATFR